jgi:hypothetical protein
MLATHVPIPILIPGTMTANASLRFKTPIGLQLTRVSAACNASSVLEPRPPI